MRHASEIFAAAFSPDGKLVVTGGFDHTAAALGRRDRPFRRHLP